MFKQTEKSKQSLISTNYIQTKAVSHPIGERKDEGGFSERQSNILIDNREMSNVLQRAIDVSATEKEGGVVIKAVGTVRDFKNGDSATNNGWNGVGKYMARVYVGEKKISSRSYDNNYRSAQAGHVLAEQNGGFGSDPDNVFAQDGGVNNAAYRSDFENPMRRELDKSHGDTVVDFRAALIGHNITQGALEKESAELERSDDELYDTTASEASDDSESD